MGTTTHAQVSIVLLFRWKNQYELKLHLHTERKNGLFASAFFSCDVCCHALNVISTTEINATHSVADAITVEDVKRFQLAWIEINSSKLHHVITQTVDI